MRGEGDDPIRIDSAPEPVVEAKALNESKAVPAAVKVEGRVATSDLPPTALAPNEAKLSAWMDAIEALGARGEDTSELFAEFDALYFGSATPSGAF